MKHQIQIIPKRLKELNQFIMKVQLLFHLRKVYPLAMSLASVVQDNAPKNASHTSPDIQKEILYVFSTKIEREIRQEIGDAKFSIIVDESRNESKREQMALILRFVHKNGFICEQLFSVVHVRDTKAITLRDEIFSILARHNLSIQNIRGQGYDGASNMRGEWNGLQVLVCDACPYAYYIHCLAHRLQLALVVASREVANVHQFFTNLVFIINIVTASTKRNDKLKRLNLPNLLKRLQIISLNLVET
ncbi:uncharacterized protein LOC126661039 [Mercurialis annua]|uniref:uncharacterized protein LOC126661039 n=1 Tax=Mercurialis annua TaxID=3986 RepID=UPI00215EDA20|nr:uncharacterized protein LOC126661039 [Mercurialis annua]